MRRFSTSRKRQDTKGFQRGAQRIHDRHPCRREFRLDSLEPRQLLAAVFVADINPGAPGSGAGSLTAVGSTLYFVATDGQPGSELWQSAGTAGSTSKVLVLNPAGSSFISRLTNINGQLFFVANNGTTGGELWATGGGSASLLRDIFPGDISSTPSDFVSYKGQLFFSADGGSSDGGSGYALWRSDGTPTPSDNKDFGPGGTKLAADPDPKGSSDFNHDHPYSLTVFKGMLYFGLNDEPIFNGGGHGTELWSTDGTKDNTELFADINSTPTSGGFKSSSNPSSLTVVDDTMYFIADDGRDGTELWKTDGTLDGTELVVDINAGSAGSNPLSLVASGGKLFFTADDGIHGRELWAADGFGAHLVKDIVAGSAGAGVQNTIDVNGTLYFTANDGQHGAELWKSDGSGSGTVMVTDIVPGLGSSDPSSLASIGGRVFFSATDSVHGTELWQSDGTAAGTFLNADIVSGFGSSRPASLTNVGGTLYFVATDTAHGTELWTAGPGTPPPVLLANAGSDFSANEGDTVQFDGTLSTGEVAKYEWDFDGNGIYNDAAGPTPTRLYVDNGIFNAGLRVTDALGLTSTDTVQVGVANVPPAMPTDAIKTKFLGVPILPHKFKVKLQDISDVGVDDVASLEGSWDFGDGLPDLPGLPKSITPFAPISNPDTLKVTHSYLQADSYTAHFTVRDKDGGLTTVNTPIRLVGADVVGKVVSVAGGGVIRAKLSSPRAQRVISPRIRRLISTSEQEVEIFINGVSQGTFLANRINIYGGASNDKVVVDKGINIPCRIDGGAGNDTLTGGGGNDTLLGSNGNDVLKGNAGKDKLIGGAGTNRLLDLSGA